MSHLLLCALLYFAIVIANEFIKRGVLEFLTERLGLLLKRFCIHFRMWCLHSCIWRHLLTVIVGKPTHQSISALYLLQTCI